MSAFSLAWAGQTKAHHARENGTAAAYAIAEVSQTGTGTIDNVKVYDDVAALFATYSATLADGGGDFIFDRLLVASGDDLQINRIRSID